MPTAQTLNVTVGTDGRVKNRTGGADTILALLDTWEIAFDAETAPVLTFESAADTVTGGTLVYPSDTIPTIGKWSGTMSGFWNLNAVATTEAGTTQLRNGARLTVDLITSKGSNLGYPLCTVAINNVKTGPKAANMVVPFSCTYVGRGVPPAFGTVS